MRLSLALDVRMWNHPGIGRYIRELSQELLQSNRDFHFHFLGPKASFACPEFQGQAQFVEVKSPIYSVSEQIEIYSKASPFDILHTPHFNIPVLRNKKLAVTIHDLIYLHDATASKSKLGRAYAEFLFKSVVQKAAVVLTVSQYTKEDLLNRFPKMKAERVFVTPEAASPHFKPIQNKELLVPIQKKYNLSRPFVLYVGSIKAHKNISDLVRAMDILKQKNRLDHDLLLVGRPDKKNPVLLESFCRHSFVRHLGEVTDDELLHLYNLSSAFVLPSFFEGFGLPVLEAMACGVPVITSDRTSLPEVGGEAALRYTPGHVDALADLLYNVLHDKEIREKMSQLGLKQALNFSWKSTAQKTLLAYKQAVS